LTSLVEKATLEGDKVLFHITAVDHLGILSP